MGPQYRTTMLDTMGSLNKSTPCSICCGRNKALDIRHVHLSTTFYNKNSARIGEDCPYCYFCDRRHPIDNMTRQKIVLTTSTLNGIQFMEGWDQEGFSFHCDIESIAGANITTLSKAWERSYMDNPLPTDTILVAGLNDIRYLARFYSCPGKDKSAIAETVSEEILSRIKHLHGRVLEHSTKYGVEDTLAVATVLHVPALYWPAIHGEYPSPGYSNLKEVVDRTNLKIEEFNLTVGVGSAPKVHLIGERLLRKKGRVFMWEAFREVAKDQMMHLKDRYRFKLMHLIVKYLEKGTAKAIEIQIQE